MIPYSLEHIVAELNSNGSAAQALIEAFTGRVIAKADALNLLKRLPDHKWYLSERLGRDVGPKVAAVDLVENFYEPPRRKPSVLEGFLKDASYRVGSWVLSYFTAKGALTQEHF